MYDIASTTSATIAPYEKIAALAAAVFLGLFIIEFLVSLLAQRVWPIQPASQHPPMM
jgi:hypothetical protein